MFIRCRRMESPMWALNLPVLGMKNMAWVFYARYPNRGDRRRGYGFPFMACRGRRRKRAIGIRKATVVEADPYPSPCPSTHHLLVFRYTGSDEIHHRRH